MVNLSKLDTEKIQKIKSISFHSLHKFTTKNNRQNNCETMKLIKIFYLSIKVIY